MDQVICAGCGQVLEATQEETPRIPCANCGATSRQYNKHLESRVVASDHAMGTGLREGRPFAFTESERAHMTRYASLEPDGTIILDLRGLSPRNEEDTAEVCRILVRALSAPNRPIEIIGPGRQDVDVILEDAGERYGVQVVRAMTNSDFWKGLAKTGRISRLPLTVSVAVEALKKAVEHKGTIPQEQRSSLVLALDALRIPALALGVVVDEFRVSWGDWARSLGFRGVFVVGPDPSFVARLDASQGPPAV